MKEILRYIYYSILKLLPDKLVINIENMRTYHRFLNEKSPEYFGEKIQWLKLYGNLEKYKNFVDKYKVRDFVKEKIGEEYLIPLLGVYDKAEEINYEVLPQNFVLKINNGSGYNIIVKGKNNIKKKKINRKLNRWLKEDYSKIKKENQYKNVERKILCEEFICDKNQELLDYKFFCFDGEPQFVKVDFDRFTNHTVNFYNMKWEKLGLKECGYENYNENCSAPPNFNNMIEIAKKLSKGFNFVRVDLYNVDGQIYFGELTFTPASGKNSFLPLGEDKKIAKGIKINREIKVLMVGPARNVKGGMTTVVDNYFDYGLHEKVCLKYIETINDKSKISKFFKEIRGMCEFKRNIRKFDVIHIHMASRRSTFRKAKYARVAKKYGKKVIIHMHGAEYKIFFEECNETKKKYVKDTLNLADRIIVLSEEWREYFSTLVENNKIEVIHNSVNLPKDFEKNLNSSKLLFLGRIGHRKGIYDLLDVMEQICEKYRDSKLYIGGDGEVEKVIQIIKEKKLTNNVEYIGWVTGEKKDELLRECSFYILPSYNEGMPMSVLEGMAYKNVTISTNVGGIPQVIRNEENGIIIEPGDKKELYNSLLKLLENYDIRKKYSENARKTIENDFNILRNIERVINIYKEV